MASYGDVMHSSFDELIYILNLTISQMTFMGLFADKTSATIARTQAFC